MTIRLRGHHLLCLLTYTGEGYSPDFVENYDKISARLAGGEMITIIDGPDDVCEPLLCDADCHCYGNSVIKRDRIALSSLSRQLNQTLQSGSTLSLTTDLLEKLRSAFTAGTIRQACTGCEWSDLCTKIAGQNHYANVKIKIPAISV